jgi:hypothetical protein
LKNQLFTTGSLRLSICPAPDCNQSGVFSFYELTVKSLLLYMKYAYFYLYMPAVR